MGEEALGLRFKVGCRVNEPETINLKPETGLADFKLDILNWKKDQIEKLINQSHREIVNNEGVEFSVVIEASLHYEMCFYSE